MSLEAIQKITELERQLQEEKRTAELEACDILVQAEKNGAAMLADVREDAAAKEKDLMAAAERRAVERTADIQRTARTEGDALRTAAEQRMREAVELIVGRVVNH